MPPTACDGCHRRKERCLFDPIEGRCRQCKLKQSECTFERRSRRMGRPPATKKLPYGFCEVIVVEADPQPPLQTSDHPAAAASSSSASSHDTESLEPLLHAPHDPATGSEPATCSPGLPYASLADLFAFMDELDNFPIGLSAVEDKSVHEILSDPQTFYDFHQHFMIGRSFSDDFRQAVMTVLESSDGVVLDAYRTVLALWDARKDQIKEFSELDLSQGSHCLKRLQAPAIVRPEDAAAVVMLGQILIVYHVVALGTSAHAILRRSLILVKDWYPSLLRQPALYAITITPILADTVESLVRRQVPVIRAPADDNADGCIVDRSAGVCLGLLHLQYEVCRIGHLAKTSTVISDGESYGTTANRHVGIYSDDLNDIRKRVSDWEPRPSSSFFSKYTQLEVSAMMMQARVYRLATLLIIHRLQFPLGVEDEPAARLAMAMAAELECFVSWVPANTKGIPIGFPLLVAMLEIDHISERVIRYVSPITSEPTYIDQLMKFVQLIKTARDCGFCGLWFDIAEDKLSIPVLA